MRKPGVFQSVVLVQHMFMYTIAFAEKQGVLFLRKPGDFKHRKDVLSKTQNWESISTSVWHMIC